MKNNSDTNLIEGIDKLVKKMPKFRVAPANKNDKEDIKKAKMMQKLINYQFKNNINGAQTKYFMLQDKLAKMYAEEMLYGIKVRWDTVEKEIKVLNNLTSKEKGGE